MLVPDWLRPRLPLLGLVAVGVCVALWVGRTPDPLDNPAFDALARAHGRKMAADAAALDSATHRVARDTVRVRSVIAHYDTLRDTLNIHDTVQVKVIVAKADSVVRACSDLVLSCVARSRIADSVIADLRLDNDVLRAARPTGLRKFWNDVKVPLAFVGGVIVGVKVTR